MLSETDNERMEGCVMRPTVRRRRRRKWVRGLDKEVEDGDGEGYVVSCIVMILAPHHVTNCFLV